jgi:hypothetical protein
LTPLLREEYPPIQLAVKEDCVTEAEERVKVTVFLARSLWKRAKFQAVEEERDLREIVTDALEEYLSKRKGSRGGRHAR